MSSAPPIVAARAPRADAKLLRLPRAKRDALWSLHEDEGMTAAEISAWLKRKRWKFRGNLVRAGESTVYRFLEHERRERERGEILAGALAQMAEYSAGDAENMRDTISMLLEVGAVEFLEGARRDGNNKDFARIANAVAEHNRTRAALKKAEAELEKYRAMHREAKEKGGWSEEDIGSFERETGIKMD